MADRFAPKINAFHIRPGEPGIRRNQLIAPRPGQVRADVEDEFHHFWVELDHDGEYVLAIRTKALRQPWTTCGAAGTFLGARFTGKRLSELASLDSPLVHCTHQYDLALLAAAHALDEHPTLYSSYASDRRDPVQHAELYQNGELALSWDVAQSEIQSAGIGQGQSLRKLKQWEGQLTPWEREMAHVLRRTIFISGGRDYDYDSTPTADKVLSSVGACFTFQPDRAPHGRYTHDRHNFDDGSVPLAERIEAVRREVDRTGAIS